MVRDKKMHRVSIIRAATAEFLKYGFMDASMRRIASEAGMSVSGLYKHFAGKEEMFSALVDPAYNGLMSLFRQESDEQIRSVQHNEQNCLESGRDASDAISYIYDNLDAFTLIVCKSKGTKYESFIHDLAVLEEQITVSFMSAMKEQGADIKDYDKKELHLLTTVNIGAIFQTVEHGFTREEAMHYAETLDRFFNKAWGEFFGY